MNGNILGWLVINMHAFQRVQEQFLRRTLTTCKQLSMISVVSNLTGKQRQETTWLSVVIDMWQRIDVSRCE